MVVQFPDSHLLSSAVRKRKHHCEKQSVTHGRFEVDYMNLNFTCKFSLDLPDTHTLLDRWYPTLDPPRRNGRICLSFLDCLQLEIQATKVDRSKNNE